MMVPAMTSQIGRQQLRQRHNPKGFTLLEILLVAVIVAILIAIATPQFRKTLTSIQLANTTQDIAQFMRFLRVKASTEKKVYQLKFDLAGLRYSSQNESRQIPSGINVTLTINPINFYPDGSIDKATVFLFKGKEEFYKDIEKAVNKEFDLGQIQTVSHTEYIYTITTQPSIGRVEVTVPE